MMAEKITPEPDVFDFGGDFNSIDDFLTAVVVKLESDIDAYAKEVDQDIDKIEQISSPNKVVHFPLQKIERKSIEKIAVKLEGDFAKVARIIEQHKDHFDLLMRAVVDRARQIIDLCCAPNKSPISGSESFSVSFINTAPQFLQSAGGTSSSHEQDESCPKHPQAHFHKGEECPECKKEQFVHAA